MCSSLADIVDRVDRENYESFCYLTQDLRDSIKSFGYRKTAGQAVIHDPASCRTVSQQAAWAERAFQRTAEFVEAEIVAGFKTTDELHTKFTHAMNGFDIEHVTPQELATMSGTECREALLLACKVICDLAKLSGLRNAKCLAVTQRLNMKTSHEHLFYEEALKTSRELEEKSKECAGLVSVIKAAVERMSTLGVDVMTKPSAAKRNEPELPPKLNAAIANVQQMLDSKRSKSKRLQDQVKYFKKKLDAHREPDSSEDKKDLQAQLDATKAEGSATKKLTDELVEKLRCQICMDRQRDTAFACGHTCCKPCSVKWEKCTFNCVSERRQKPIKFTFPIFFN